MFWNKHIHFSEIFLLSKYYIMDNQNNFEKLLTELLSKMDNLNICPELKRSMIPKHELMEFLGFAETQMSYIARKYNLETITISKRKFYLTSSILKAMDNNKNSNN